MDAELKIKLDRLIKLLEEQELQQYRDTCLGNKNMLRDTVLNTVLASALGYFMFRVFDMHFRKSD